jgi:transcriptional regulator with XRE-family HTH domain
MTTTLAAPLIANVRFNLIFLRAQRGLTQAELADKAGISRAYIVKLEQAGENITLFVLAGLAHALNVPPERLLRETASDDGMPDVRELRRRAKAPRGERVDARALLAAIDEARDAK